MAEAAEHPGSHIDLAWREPADALAPLRDEPGALLLQGGGAGASGRYSYLCAFPDFVLQKDDPHAAMAALRAQAHRLSAPTSGEGFRGGFAGLFSYELGAAFERMPTPGPAVQRWPAMALGWYAAVAEFDHASKRLTVCGDTSAAARLAEALGRTAPPQDAGPGALDMAWSRERYLDAARQAVDYVRAGDVFQVNLSHAFRGRLPGPDGPYRLARRLAAQSPAAHGAYFRLDAERCVITNSPERFLRVSPDGAVETRPIKGTRARRADPAADAAAITELQRSAKDRAENLMIVDLMRNDLARVCQTGSVKVPDLFRVESFANVHHLVSTVTGQLEKGRGIIDLIAAAFPPGSITGAPKVRAMEIIAEIEGERRGPYCGALGWIGADGAADLNVMIRTAACVREAGGWSVEVRSGGAITSDSEPADELEETRAKAGALARAIGDD